MVKKFLDDKNSASAPLRKRKNNCTFYHLNFITMTLNEWILLIGITLIIFFVSEIVRKKLKAGTRIIFSLVSFIMLMTVFIINAVTHRFAWMRIIVLSFFAILWVVSFYYQVKKYQHANKGGE
jgi:hypothetical protein